MLLWMEIIGYSLYVFKTNLIQMLVIQYSINVVVMVIVLMTGVYAMPDGITIQIVVPETGISSRF